MSFFGCKDPSAKPKLKFEIAEEHYIKQKKSNNHDLSDGHIHRKLVLYPLLVGCLLLGRKAVVGFLKDGRP